jgi:hypothetical protein
MPVEQDELPMFLWTGEYVERHVERELKVLADYLCLLKMEVRVISN